MIGAIDDAGEIQWGSTAVLNLPADVVRHPRASATALVFGPGMT